MLRVLKAQKRIFDAAALEEYACNAAARIAREFSTDAAIMGADGVRAFVDAGIDRAARHGIDSEQGVGIYLNLMLLLGADFDIDPQLPWAASVLEGAKGPGAGQVPMRLQSAADDYLVEVAGENYRYLREAYRRAGDVRFEELPTTMPDAAISDLLGAVYPEKHAHLGAVGVLDLVRRAREAAERHGLGGGRALATYATSMFLLGSGFDRDPALPWASRILEEKGAREQRAGDFARAVRTELARYGA